MGEGEEERNEKRNFDKDIEGGEGEREIIESIVNSSLQINSKCPL